MSVLSASLLKDFFLQFTTNETNDWMNPDGNTETKEIFVYG